jgi:hypothetical protein
MSPDAHVVPIERSDTTDDTSDFAGLTAAQMAEVEAALIDYPDLLVASQSMSQPAWAK